MRDTDTGDQPGPNPARPAVTFAELAWVALGGAVGTLARYLLAAAIGEAAGLPLGIFVINVGGAFLLGLLLESLALSGPDRGMRRRSRLLLGTGVLGGFTTYSLLATDLANLLLTGNLLAGVGYGVGTLLVGGAATLFGVVAARSVNRSSRGAE